MSPQPILPRWNTARKKKLPITCPCLIQVELVQFVSCVQFEAGPGSLRVVMWATSSLIFYADCSLHVWESFLLFGNLYSFVLQENKASGRTFTKHLIDVTMHQLNVQLMCLLLLFHWKRSGLDIWSLFFPTKSPKKKKKKIV